MGLVKSRIQIKGSGSTTVSANNGTITIKSTGGGDTLWTRKDETTIQPASNTDDVSVGNGKITLRGSGAIQVNCGNNPRYEYYPTISYDTNLIIKDKSIITCSLNYIHINQNGIGLGATPDSFYKLNVNGGARMNNLTVSSSATIGSHEFYNTKVGINGGTTNGNDANLQVHGAISIENNFSGAPDSSTTCTAGSIAYRDGTFYGCTNNTWKIFNMSDISGGGGGGNNGAGSQGTSQGGFGTPGS